MADAHTPPLYDVDKAMREIARARRKRDTLTSGQAYFGDQFASSMNRHFAAEEIETAGRALLIAAGYAAELCKHGTPPQMIANILGFAGDRLIRDGRAMTEIPLLEAGGD